MKAIYLVRKGNAAKAFETREVPVPVPGPGQVLIKVKAFGLNYADVMARMGLYQDAPPMPFVPGYDVAGTIIETGEGVINVKIGDEVLALVRFGGYATHVIAEASAITHIPASLDAAGSVALAVQYCTAYYMANKLISLQPGEKVLIHAGAGGVGTALIQWAKYRNCEIFSTAGSAKKLDYLTKQGVHHPINYLQEDFEQVMKSKTNGKGVDVIFDAIGGASVKKGYRILAPGGRMICFGAADFTNKSLFGKIGLLLKFGLYHPVGMMSASKSLLGVNLLRIADEKKELIGQCLQEVAAYVDQGVFTPGKPVIYPVSDLALAHNLLENRGSIGKIVIEWLAE